MPSQKISSKISPTFTFRLFRRPPETVATVSAAPDPPKSVERFCRGRANAKSKVEEELGERSVELVNDARSDLCRPD